MNKNSFQVLLYYKYVSLDIPERVRDEQKALCERLHLKGRIILAKEGINGTVEGTKENTELYIKEMEKTPYFKGIHYKMSAGNGAAFPKLSIRVRPEIVTTKVPGLDPTRITGKYLTADELHIWFENKKEFYIVDMRNDFEYSSGYFEGFIPSGMKHFFELSSILPRLQHLKNKTIVTVCTGGIRCEKASGFLIQNGFENVYQLYDGIVTYMEKYPNQHFKGKLYVFDNRLTMGFNVDSPEHEIVGKCMHCNVTTDTYVNCEYDECHYHYIACEECRDKETGYYFCKAGCKYIWIDKMAKKSHTI